MKWREELKVYFLTEEEATEISGWFRSRVPWWLVDQPSNIGNIEDIGGLYRHQSEAVAWLEAMRQHRAMRGGLIADDMGLGKTISAIVYANRVKAKGVIVVAPAHLLRNWAKEIERWQELGFPVKIVKHDVLAVEGNWYIVSYSSLKKLDYENIGDGEGWIVILDEAHYIKNIEAQRTQRMMHMRHSMARAFFVLLSGTPITNRANDLFTLVDMVLKPDWNTFRINTGQIEDIIPKKAYRLWLKRYVRFGLQRIAGGRLIEKPIGNMRVDELQKLLGHIMLRRKKEQVLDLPEKVVEYITVDIPAKWRKEAQDIFEKLKEEGYKLRFSQHIQHVLQEYGLAKVKPAVGIITDSVQDRGPVVVWAVHHSVIDALVYELGKKGLKVVKADGRDSDKVKEKAVEDFQKGNYDVFVAGLTAMNTGYTMTRSNTAIFVQTTFTPSDMRQAEDRIYRIGQTKDVLIWYLVGDNGEEAVLKAWRKKEIEQIRVVDRR